MVVAVGPLRTFPMDSRIFKSLWIGLGRWVPGTVLQSREDTGYTREPLKHRSSPGSSLGTRAGMDCALEMYGDFGRDSCWE